MTDCIDDSNFSMKSVAALQRSLHFNAPHSVVDPLISLLYDLRRIEESIFSSLVEMGVDVDALPLPIRPTRSSPAPTVPSPSVPPAKEEHTSPESFVSRYVRTALAKDTCSLQEKATAVETVLTYVDAQQPLPPSSDETCPDDTAAAAAKGRRLLSVLVASSDAGEERSVWVDSRPETTVEEPPRKKQKQEAPLRVLHSPKDVLETRATLFGEYSAADVERMLRDWAHYESGLQLAVEDMKPLLRALCATTIAGSLSSHAKWIEMDKEDLQKPLTLPSSVAMRQAAEEVIAMNDALATVQVPVHEAYQSLVRAVEDYTTECVFVGEYERQYWEKVKKFELEYRALREMKLRIGKIRGVVQASLE